jgi:threonine dehydratase
VWLKLEIVQRTGSFKLRGAANAMTRRLEARTGFRDVVTASAGNHGQAVAYVARELGLSARVYVPKTAPEAKRNALRGLGADTIETPTYDDAERQAHDVAERTGTPYLSPYDDDDVIAGAGTVALEMLAERPELDTFIVPVGGGGLLAATAIVAHAKVPRPMVIGVEAAASPVFTAALAAGRPVTVDVRDTLADGLAGNMDPASRTFPLVRDLVSRVEKIEEPAIARAMRELILRERLVAEGAGAIGVAALLSGGLDLQGRHVGVILSGRNVDESVIRSVLAV